ncbi:MAG: hypothetical protein GXX93_11090 [Anaerolineae bacterium]|nr:hypothetical protein [Anaerolineae bacterium]
MTHDELLAWCRRAPDRGATKHEEFIDYITLIERRQRVDNRWVTRALPYMSVDGRLAMANVDHDRQGKRLTFHDPVVLADTEQQVTLMVLVESEVYGRRHGIATSRKAEGSSIETQHPWEIAETSAMGRALAAMGYGLLPGSDAYSSHDQPAPAIESGRPEPQESLSEKQKEYLINTAAEALALSQADAGRYVNRLCQERYGHSLSDCSRDEGRSLALELRRPAPKADEGGSPTATRQGA